MISLDAWLHHVPWTSRVSMQFSHLSASILESSLDFHYLSNELLFLSELEEFSRRSPLLGLSSLSQCRFLSSPFCNKLLLLFIYKTVSEFVCSALVLEPHSCSWYWHLLRLFFLLVAFYKNTSWTEKILQIYPDYLRKVTKKKKSIKCSLPWALPHLSISSQLFFYSWRIYYGYKVLYMTSMH